LFHDFFVWLRDELGRSGDGQSWSQQIAESLNLWNVTEGTHVLTLMFFAGTIWLVDLRMMGVAFRNVPVSTITEKVLPITQIAFVVMVVTGVISFLGRDPVLYYHDVWFRLKMIFLILATINIFWFHNYVQKGMAEWDADPSPPMAVKLSGAFSLTAWIIVIIFGRFIAYDWYRCEKVEPGSFVYWFAEPAADPEATPADPAAPANEPAPAEGAVEPVPGNGG
jgi:hypothetical protein